MKNNRSQYAQRGATLFVGLIILVLMTLIAVSAFTISSSNQKAVANMQYKYASIAAANQAIEQVIGSPFTDAPAAETILIDSNNDGITDYTVQIAKPTCVRVAIDSSAILSSVQLSTSMASTANFLTLWEIEAVVNDPISGANTTVRSGVRVVLTQAQKDAVCV